MQVTASEPLIGGETLNTSSGHSRLCDVIDISSDGTSILGSSTLYTRYWTGYISVFQSPEALTAQTKSNSTFEFEGGLACARLIPNTKHVIAGSDTGLVSLINVKSAAELIVSAPEHDNVVSSLSLSSDGSKAVTGSFDRSLKVWHTDYLICSHTYRPAHGDMVVSASINQQDDNVMVSCSEDGQVIIWDLRMTKPARELQQSLFVSRPSCVSFLTGHGLHSNSLMIGTLSGHLLQLDASSLKTVPLFELGAHSRPVTQICPTSFNGDTLIATCAEDNKTVVASVDPAHPKIIYTDERHNDAVRGLAWSIKDDARRLYSCSWDGQVLVHDIACGN